MLIFQKAAVDKGLTQFKVIFNIFVAVIAAIALIITFFLLMISTTQNINEAVWEFGVLRSMGLTQAEGRRIFMYEAFMVVCTALILGFFVGLLVTLMVTAQFYLFIEQPLELEWPGWLLLGMLVVSLVTTFVAVHIPVRNLNKKQVA